ncbi:Uncharacterized protein PECH_004934 [Penicillium ucsense]|uniref:Uncharacterized protein n=1 Tax=Penicillium ucsense TaxID=2839758 RepID=A0A8J8WHI4_9EURO|nr:Uncharacterized protein PECM_008302 [Penicillium ucsense]KAF7736725.1 Uncharacterized protein PECH_004934 [Penicillium ucsense]
MAQVRPTVPGRRSSARAFESKLSQQLSQSQSQPDNVTLSHECMPRSPKARSLSDVSRPTALAQPSSGDLNRPPSKDDSAIPSVPATPSRSTMHQPNFSLHLNSRAGVSPTIASRAPLSPKLDPTQAAYGSPGSVLPRRSRGLDFSRACTNLHHSTLAQSSPESSPTVGGRGMMIPQRRSSPGLTSGPPFSNSGPADRTGISSSVSSVNMLESDTSSSEDDEDAMMGDRDDMMLSTPQAARISAASSLFATGPTHSPGNEWMGNYSQATASLMSFQRARIHKGRSRHSSSSASGNSSKPSPGPHSPPVMKSVENPGAGYFAPRHSINARRESLSLGTRDLRLSDLSDDGENRGLRGGSPLSGSHPEGGPLGVIRRAVTRRGSLLPKTKTFARIRAALMEEGAPVDSDMKREAEVIRQVRDTEPDTSPTLRAVPSPGPPQPGAGAFDMDTTDAAAKPGTSTAPASSFSKHASQNSGGVDFWNSMDGRYRTPPPSRQSALPADDDIPMDMTPSTTLGSAADSKQRSQSSTPYASGVTAIGEICRKRRRDDDLDPNLFKRRAVSPSVSAQGSPVLTHSSTIDTNAPNIWGPPTKLGPPFSERPIVDQVNGNGNSGVVGTATTPNANRTSFHAGSTKRVGLQGMTEASDGFMNMSIE